MKVLIDGHNALGALDVRGRTHEECRHSLMSIVAGIAPGATIFFDARRAPAGLFEREAMFGILAIYCREREADEFILDAVRDALQPTQVLVVSNDRRITGTARQYRARTVSIEEFFRKKGRKAPSQPAAKLEQRARRIVRIDFKPGDFGLPDEIDLDSPPEDLD